MDKAWSSEYFQDGKKFKSKKKNGAENKFEYTNIEFLEFENKINSTISFLEKNGVTWETIKTRDAYEMTYKLYSMQKREI